MAGKFWRLMGEYDAETKTYSKFVGGAGSSPYTPDFSGRLKALRTQVVRNAASSLVNGVQIKLTSANFTPNAIECGANGSGLQTAPAFQVPEIDFVVDQPVISGVPIVMEGQNITADTPVTCSVLLWGYFEI
jgi:hypothetical protein